MKEIEKIKQQLSDRINREIKQIISKARAEGEWLRHREIFDKYKLPVSQTTFYNSLNGKCSVDSMLKILNALGAELI